MRDKLIELISATKYGNGSEVGKNFQRGFVEKIVDHLIAHGVTVQEWVSVEDALPETEQIVRIACKQGNHRYECVGFYVPPKTLRAKSEFNWDYECCDEYCEEEDDYFVNSGWYERIYNWDNYGAVDIGAKVTHWMPLPEPPKEE